MKVITTFLMMAISLISLAQSSITWTMGTNIASNSHSNMHPRITVDGSGNPLVIWGRMSDASVFFSRWNGIMFTAPVKLNPTWLTVATASWMGPDIASHGDTVYVVMKQTPEADTSSHIYITTSFNGGVSFSAPVRVDFIADSISRFPAVTVDANGNPIVAFMKLNNSFFDSRWVVSKSSDFGNTFSADVKASGWSSGASTACDCCPGAITSSGSAVAMLYRDNDNNIRDSWAGISADSGNTFTSGINIDQNNWMLMSCPATGPDGELIGDTLFSVFMNEASGTARTYFSKASLNNLSVAVTPLTGNIMGLNQQNDPRIATNGNAVAVVWKQNINGNTQLPILFTNDIANGLPAAYDTVDLNDITNADVALSNGNVYVVWQDDNSGTVKYRTGNYSPVTASLDEEQKNDFNIYPNPGADYFNIHYPSNESANVVVTDVLGRPVYSQQMLSGQNINLINTTHWQNGIYFITLQNGNSNITKKMMVQHLKN